MKLDNIDKELLRLLDNDSRLSIAELAKQLSVTRDQIAYRMTNFDSNNLITRYTVTFNPYKLGLTLYKMYLTLEQGGKHAGKIINYLKELPGVFWISEGDGRWDLLFGVYAYSPYQFAEVQDRLIENFSTYISTFDTYTLIEGYFYPRKYLGKNKNRSYMLGGKHSNIRLDEIDQKLLYLLTQNSRKPLTAIAEETGASATSITNRLKKLYELEIITGSCIDLNISKINYEIYKAQLNLKSYDKFKELNNFCKNHPNVIYLIRQLGESKVEIEVEAENFEHYQAIINEFRSKLVTSIRTIKMKNSIYLWLPPST